MTSASTRNTGATGSDVEVGPVDFAIITALPVELAAVRAKLNNPRPLKERDSTITYYRGQVSIPGTDRFYEVVVAGQLTMGNIDAGITTTKTLERWKPRYVLLVGIAGGVKGKVKLGDVVVAEFVNYYEQAKVMENESEVRPRQYPAGGVLYNQVVAYEELDWRAEIGVASPSKAKVVTPSGPKFGPIAAGEKVIKDQASLDALVVQCPKMLAVAMEGAGAAHAVYRDPRKSEFLEIRGICDYANNKKNDRWHKYAANAAAAFAIGFLRYEPVSQIAAETPKSGAPARPLLILKAQSLTTISDADLLAATEQDLGVRDHTVVSLDFTSHYDGTALKGPQVIATSLADPRGSLYSALGTKGNAELVFCAMAHIPILVLTGHLVSDRQPVHMYDYQPAQDPPSFKWPGGEYPPLTVKGLPEAVPSTEEGEVVIRVAVSAPVTSQATKPVVPNSLCEIDLAIPDTRRNKVVSEAQVREYGAVFRETLERVMHLYPKVIRIHLFYAGPCSLAFHLGQQISENMHPPVVVWNYAQGAYKWGINMWKARMGEADVIDIPPDHSMSDEANKY